MLPWRSLHRWAKAANLFVHAIAEKRQPTPALTAPHVRGKSCKAGQIPFLCEQWTSQDPTSEDALGALWIWSRLFLPIAASADQSFGSFSGLAGG